MGGEALILERSKKHQVRQPTTFITKLGEGRSVANSKPYTLNLLRRVVANSLLRPRKSPSPLVALF